MAALALLLDRHNDPVTVALAERPVLRHPAHLTQAFVARDLAPAPINDHVAQPRRDPHDDVIVLFARTISEADIVNLDGTVDRHLIAPAAPVEVGEAPKPLVRELRARETLDAVAIVLRPRLLHGAKELLSLGVHHVRRELASVLSRLARGKLDTLLAPPTSAARERVHRAEHGPGGPHVLCDVQADAGARARCALRAHRGGNDQHRDE